MASQLCTPDFTGFLQNCYQAKIQKKFCGFLHSRPFLHGQTVCHDQNRWQMPERMITSTICRDEPKFYLNLVNFDVEVYVTHSISAMDSNVRHEKKKTIWN